MTDRDLLYSVYQKESEQRKRRNFDALMDGLEDGLVSDLNKAYKSGDEEQYKQMVRNIKSKGIKVLRNSKGDHKVKFI